MSTSLSAQNEWLSYSEVARRTGISQPGVKKKVDRLVAAGLLECRPGPNGSKLIQFEAYEAASAANLDAAATFSAAHVPKKGAPAGDKPILASPFALAQAEHKSTQAELAKLELAERRGELLRREDVLKAEATCCEAIIKALDRVATTYDERIADAVGKDGVLGSRMELKSLVFDVRKEMERAALDLAEKWGSEVALQ